MKKKYGLCIGFAALLTAALLIFAGCGDGAGGHEPIPPTEISSLEDLIAISANAESLSKNYKLMADITGVTTPIGSAFEGQIMPFTGDFDGNGKTITLNITSGLTVSGNGPFAGTYAGLFAAVGDISGNPGTRGVIHDLKVVGTITITGTGAAVYAGGVVGGILPTAGINKVASSVNIIANSSGNIYAGGILGGSQGGVINNVYTTGDISATTSGKKSVRAGGIAGGIEGGAVSYAYATGRVIANGTGTGNGNSSGENDIAIGACGIVGGAGADPIKYTVALNSSIGVADGCYGRNYKSLAFRIASADHGKVNVGSAINYGKSDLTPIGGLSHSGPDKGADQQDGVDTNSPAPDESWWKDTAWKTAEGANWTTVWGWSSAKGLPELRFLLP